MAACAEVAGGWGGGGHAAAGFDMDAPPTTWESQASPVQVFTVAPDSPEHAMVSSAFYASLKRDVEGIVNIDKLERIQNIPLWEEVSTTIMTTAVTSTPRYAAPVYAPPHRATPPVPPPPVPPPPRMKYVGVRRKVSEKNGGDPNEVSREGGPTRVEGGRHQPF